MPAKSHSDTQPHARGDAPHPYREPASRKQGNVTYLSGEALERPLDMPKNVMRGLMLIIIAAAVIGAIFLIVYLDSMVNGPAREQALVEEYVAREADLDLPVLPELIPLDDAAIMAKLEESGATLFERTPSGSDKPFEVIKLPGDVTLAEAASLYLKGVSSLSASEAARLLNGSWDLTVNRDNGMNMGIHYADFTSESLERAVGAAARSQGFDTEGNVDSGVDSSGNTYISGSTQIGGESYSWKASAVPLSDVYSQAGLPESAVYVGIRVYR